MAVRLDVHVQKGTSVPIREQLVTQLSMQIAAGLIEVGAKLPSVRALSKKLGIHYNTCLAVYRVLEEKGLLTIRQGSGVTVASSQVVEPDAAALSITPGLEQLTKYFVEQVHKQGYPWAEVLRSVKTANRQYLSSGNRPLVFVDVHADIAPLFEAELTYYLKQPVRALLLDDLELDALAENTLFLVSRYHIQKLKAYLKAQGADDSNLQEQVMMIDVGRVQQELDAIKHLENGELVLVVSTSSTVLQQAEAVITALRGDELLFRSVSATEDPDDIRRALKYGHLIFADFLVAPMLGEMTRKPIHDIRVVPDEEIEKIKSVLTVETSVATR